VFSASDATVPFNSIGRTGNLTGGDTGPRTTPLNASYVQDRYNAGASHLGVMAYAEAVDRYMGINRGPGSKTPTLDLSATVPNAGQLVTRPVFDVEASSDDGVNFVLTDGDTGINVQQIDFANVDRRGILEFDLRGIPLGAEITSASVEFEINTYTYDPPADGPEVRLYGYAGNGQVDVADATRTSIPNGIGPTVTDLRPTTITLNTSVIENLLGGGSGYLGLLAVGSADFNQFGFDTLEWDVATAPHLTLNYALPLPGDFNDDSAVNADDIDLLTAAIRASSGNLTFDVNGDNAVSDDDFAHYIEDILGTHPGDTNLDGVVNFCDLAALAANYGQSPRGWGSGNANTDLAVNLIDLTTMATYYAGGQSQALADWQSLASVPEPGALGIFMLLATAGCARLRKKS
jgi:hypothetical protein